VALSLALLALITLARAPFAMASAVQEDSAWKGESRLSGYQSSEIIISSLLKLSPPSAYLTSRYFMIGPHDGSHDH
jgi:hypothetical protein